MPLLRCGCERHRVAAPLHSADAAIGASNVCQGLPVESISWGLDKHTGDFKGYAHVSFATPADAAAALSRNGHALFERPMRVAPEVRRVVPRAADGGAASAPATPAADAAALRPDGATRAYVTGMAYDADTDALEAALRAAFASCGAGGVQHVRLGRDKASGAFRGYAHLEFADTAALDAAVAASGALVLGRVVRVTHARDKPGRGAAGGAAGAPKRLGRLPSKARAGKGGGGRKQDMSRFE